MSFPSSWLQSVNSVFVIIGRAAVRRDLDVPVEARQGAVVARQFGTALVLVGLGFAVMLPAAMAIDGSDVGG